MDLQPQRPTKPSTPVQFPLSVSPHPLGSFASPLSGSSAPATPQSSPMKDPWKDAGRATAKMPLQNGFQRVEIIPQQQFSVQPVPPPFQPQQPPANPAKVLTPSIRPEEARNAMSSAFLPVLESATTNEEKLSFTRGHSRNASSDFDKPTDFTTRSSLNSSSPALSLRSSSLMSESQSTPSVPLITKAELEARITPIMAMVPLGPERPTRDMILQHTWLEAAFHNPPKPCDSERRKYAVLVQFVF